ncbi:zinc transporter ZntB [Litorimonas cladophorae]|uniref:Zinc transporter ZntB n=1 Tax=Litorimonas cladophorae TaxID=1220491 RepID=A0A918NK23_9PROT|nr:zinc transporter ZntB [Litorimonas cladophorae]GGX73516.1 zinc transporter ZntB [Litorimonas cladophorae]
MALIIHAYHVAPNGKSTRIPDAELGLPRPEGEGYDWYHLTRHDPSIQSVFEADAFLDKVAEQTLLAEDSRPRTIMRNDDVLINLRGVNLNPGSEPEDMIGIRFFVQPTRIVSVEKRPLRATGDIAARLDRQVAPKTPGGFMSTFAQAMIERMAPTITELNEQVDGLEEKIETGETEAARSSVSGLRRQAIMLRRYLAPQRDALNSLSQQTLSWISHDDQLRLREAADQATRVTEELDAVRERCAIVKDQLTDIRAEQMNNNMMILAVVSAVFLPLGLISGMMGINVGGMPWVESGMGFWYVTGIVIGVGVIQFILFRILKWV